MNAYNIVFNCVICQCNSVQPVCADDLDLCRFVWMKRRWLNVLLQRFACFMSLCNTVLVLLINYILLSCGIIFMSAKTAKALHVGRKHQYLNTPFVASRLKSDCLELQSFEELLHTLIME